MKRLILICILFLTFSSVKISADSKIDSILDSVKIDNYNFELNGNIVNRKFNGTILPVEFNDGLFDSKNNLFYYTTKDIDGWGSDEFINIYSFKEKKVIRQLKFDNSGYYKYPISISPDSKTLIIAERAQSAGNVNLSILEMSSEKEHKLEFKVHSPSISWVDNTKYIFLSPKSDCIKDICHHTALEVVKYDMLTKSGTIVSKAVDKNQDGNLPVLDHIDFSDGKIKIKSRFNKDKFNIKNIEIDINLLKNE